MKLRAIGTQLLIFVVPAIIWSVYVYASRMTRVFSPVTDYSALAAALAVGVVGTLILYRAPGIRVFAAFAYVVVTGPLMYAGMVASLCYLGDCP
jgi:hypothetical protein